MQAANGEKNDDFSGKNLIKSDFFIR